MAGRNYSTLDYFDARCAEMAPLFEFNASTESSARQWRTRALAKVRDLLGEMPHSVPLKPDIVESVDMGSYTRKKIIFDADSQSSVPSYLLIPNRLQQSAPAVLCLHDRYSSKDATVGIAHSDEEQARIDNKSRDCARQLAENGFITLTFDLRGFGERSELGLGNHQCDQLFLRGAFIGLNVLALNVHDSMRAIDLLAEIEEVDIDRIGCVGLELGGTISIWTAAMDKRIKSAVICGYMNEYEACTGNFGTPCAAEFVPALKRYFSLSDVAAIIAPRPMLLQSGMKNGHIATQISEHTVEKLKHAYSVWDKPELLQHEIFVGKNQFRCETALKWLQTWL